MSEAQKFTEDDQIGSRDTTEGSLSRIFEALGLNPDGTPNVQGGAVQSGPSFTPPPMPVHPERPEMRDSGLGQTIHQTRALRKADLVHNLGNVFGEFMKAHNKNKDAMTQYHLDQVTKILTASPVGPDGKIQIDPKNKEILMQLFKNDKQLQNIIQKGMNVDFLSDKPNPENQKLNQSFDKSGKAMEVAQRMFGKGTASGGAQPMGAGQPSVPMPGRTPTADGQPIIPPLMTGGGAGSPPPPQAMAPPQGMGGGGSSMPQLQPRDPGNLMPGGIMGNDLPSQGGITGTLNGGGANPTSASSNGSQVAGADSSAKSGSSSKGGNDFVDRLLNATPNLPHLNPMLQFKAQMIQMGLVPDAKTMIEFAKASMQDSQKRDAVNKLMEARKYSTDKRTDAIRFASILTLIGREDMAKAILDREKIDAATRKSVEALKQSHADKRTEDTNKTKERIADKTIAERKAEGEAKVLQGKQKELFTHLKTENQAVQTMLTNIERQLKQTNKVAFDNAKKAWFWSSDKTGLKPEQRQQYQKLVDKANNLYKLQQRNQKYMDSMIEREMPQEVKDDANTSDTEKFINDNFGAPPDAGSIGQSEEQMDNLEQDLMGIGKEN